MTAIEIPAIAPFPIPEFAAGTEEEVGLGEALSVGMEVENGMGDVLDVELGMNI
jgi:hypothetical protein